MINPLDRIMAKVFGTKWIIKYLKTEIKENKNYVRENKKIMDFIRTHKKLPKGMGKMDWYWFKDDIKLRKKFIRDDTKQLKKWNKLKKVL